MHSSVSAPLLASSTKAKILPKRGAHDVGTVLGINSGDELYVPRALWTETADSPLKPGSVDFDPRQFLLDERKRQAHREGMRSYLKKEMAKTLQDQIATRKAMSENEDMALAISADLQRTARQKEAVAEEEHKKRAVFRQGLNEQVAEQERRAQNSRLQLLHDAAEEKARAIQHVSQELLKQAERKKVAQQNATEILQEIQARRFGNTMNKQKENEDLLESIRQQTLQDEYRLAAQQERLKVAQASADAMEKSYKSTAGKELFMRQTQEMNRQDRDEKIYNIRHDLHYSRREEARERQKQNMVKTLDIQVAARGSRTNLVAMQKQSERDAVNASTRQHMEQELEKSRVKKAEEVENQLALVRMMAEKQDRLRKEGVRPNPSINTMAVTDSFLAMSMARASSTGKLAHSDDLMHQVDAAKSLTKPLGRADVKPWVDITRSHGVGGLTGVFSGEGNLRAKLQATGGPGRILTKEPSPLEGVSAAEMKAALKSAKERARASAADKSWA